MSLNEFNDISSTDVNISVDNMNTFTYSKDENIEYHANLCLGCGIDMGFCNPRQYCCKTYCPFEDEDMDEDINEDVKSSNMVKKVVSKIINKEFPIKRKASKSENPVNKQNRMNVE